MSGMLPTEALYRSVSWIHLSSALHLLVSQHHKATCSVAYIQWQRVNSRICSKAHLGVVSRWIQNELQTKSVAGLSLDFAPNPMEKRQWILSSSSSGQSYSFAGHAWIENYECACDVGDILAEAAAESDSYFRERRA
jgi:hypothetical protein